MDNQLIQQTLGAIVSIVQILIPLGSAFYGFYKVGGDKFVKSKIALISDKRTRDLIDAGFDRIVDLLDAEITTAESTAKPLILQKIAEGQLNKDSLKEIGIDVAKAVMSQLPEKTINLLQQEVNDVGLYVNKKLEERLDKLKQDPTSGVSKTVISEVTIPQSDVTALTNQLQQVQMDKDNLTQQFNQLSNDKANVEQTNNELVQQNSQLNNQVQELQNQITQLVTDKQIVQAKLDSVQSALNQPVV